MVPLIDHIHKARPNQCVMNAYSITWANGVLPCDGKLSEVNEVKPNFRA